MEYSWLFVTLSGAKGLIFRLERFFATLRMTHGVARKISVV